MIDYIYDAMEKFFRRVAVFSPSRRRKNSVEETEKGGEGGSDFYVFVWCYTFSVTLFFYPPIKKYFFSFHTQFFPF